MRKWEDIVKDKLEEPDGALPESVFAEFCTRLEAAEAAPAPKRFPLVWAVVPAVAAGLAAVLLLHKPYVPEGDIQIIQQPSGPVAVVTDTSGLEESISTESFVVRVAEVLNAELSTEDVSATRPEETVTPDTIQEEIPDSAEEKKVDNPIESIPSPVIPAHPEAGPASLNAGPAAGMIAGGSLVAALVSPIAESLSAKDNLPSVSEDESGTMQPKDKLARIDHYFPLKLGLSARMPISGRLSVTTGLDYSWYKSSFTYSVSGEKIQNAHYIGIPVRLDWTLASGRWLDVYLGGGLEADYCLGATLAGERIAKDGFGLSLLGAGGIQLNLTKQIGLYVEPEISWTIPSESRVLQTYRSDNPVMLSLTSGLRFNIGK